MLSNALVVYACRMEVFSVNSMLNTISRLAPAEQVTLYRGLKAKLRLEGAI
jgi:hypothetical protein